MFYQMSIAKEINKIKAFLEKTEKTVSDFRRALQFVTTDFQMMTSHVTQLINEDIQIKTMFKQINFVKTYNVEHERKLFHYLS